MAFGDAVVFFNRGLAQNFLYRCKQSGQLASKMRFIAAQWIGLLQDGAWLRNAKNANDAAALLEAKLRGLPGVRILYPRQVNAVFVDLPKRVLDGLHERGWHFYMDVGSGRREADVFVGFDGGRRGSVRARRGRFVEVIRRGDPVRRNGLTDSNPGSP